MDGGGLGRPVPATMTNPAGNGRVFMTGTGAGRGFYRFFMTV